LTFRTIYIQGDERSRTNPGHGYPASNESVMDYVSYTDRAEWERDIESLMNPKYSKKDFVAIKVSVASIETTHTVKIS
jgi:hypothetical protein